MASAAVRKPSAREPPFSLPAYPPLRQTSIGERGLCGLSLNPTKQRQGNQNLPQEVRSRALGNGGPKDGIMGGGVQAGGAML